MKKIPLLVLVGLLVVCVPVAAILLINTTQRFGTKDELIGKKIIAKGFASTELAEIRIADPDSEAHLVLADDKWVVANRDNYPLGRPDEIDQLVDSILRLKVGLEIPADDVHYAEMGLLRPDEEEESEIYLAKRKREGEENPADPRGMRVTMTGKDGKIRCDFVLGAEFGGGPEQPRRGILMRNLHGTEGIWKILGRFSRRTGAFAEPNTVRTGPISEAGSWLDNSFVVVQDLASIELTAPNDKEFTGWVLTRATKDAPFTLEGLTADEEMNSAGTAPLSNLFFNVRFEDVVSPGDAAAKTDPAGARQAVLTTLDGFVYTFTFTPFKPEKPDPESNFPPPPPNYATTVKVEGNFPETREKKPGETDERAAAEDQAHSVRRENLLTRLEREKKFEGRHYEIANFALGNLLKGRSDLVQPKTPASPGPGALPLPGAATPPGPRSLTTPPLVVPPPGPAPVPPAGSGGE